MLAVIAAGYTAAVLVAVVSALTPPTSANGRTAGDRAERLGQIIGPPIVAVSMYLLVVNGIAAFRSRAVTRMPQLDTAAADGEHVEDVSERVHVERRVARAADTAKLVGSSLLLLLLLPWLWPASFWAGAAGAVLLAAGVGVARGNSGAARILLLVRGFLAVTVVLYPLTLLFAGARDVRSGRLDRTEPDPLAAGYGRLMTGSRSRQVSALVAASTVTAVLGVLALTAGAVIGSQGEIGAVVCLALAVLPYRRARRLAALEAPALMERDSRSPILYLRSFGDDRVKIRAAGGSARHSTLERLSARKRERFEEVVAGHLWVYGPVVAVSGPGEQLAPIGAARSHFAGSAWHEGVESLLRSAAMIVITVGPTTGLAGQKTGLAWEVDKVSELGLWDRTLLLFPPVGAAELRERWDSLRAAVADTGMDLELDAEPGRVLAAAHADGALIAYVGGRRDEWHYESALRAAARRLIGGSAQAGDPQEVT